MKEVSCRALALVFERTRAFGITPEQLADGTGLSVEYLTHRSNRVDWSVWLRVLRNAGQFLDDDTFERMGGSFPRSPLFRAITTIARLLFTTTEFYHWANSGAGPQLFACVQPTCVEYGPGRMELTLAVPEGFETSHHFNLMNKGGLAAMPQLLGFTPAQVEMVEIDRGAIYRIVYPVGGGALAWLRRALAWPFTARAAARELKVAHEDLIARHQELAQARERLALQATQLQAAHEISQLVRGDLDLDKTLQAVAGALVEVGGLDAARVRVSRHGGRLGERGQAPDRVGLSFSLEGRGEPIGTLELWPRDDADERRVRELMLVVQPTIAMALVDALTYTDLLDFRQNLEAKVAARTAELSAARDELTATVEKMREAQRARDRIFANINHEIRTPLSLIQLAIDDLRRRQGPALDERAHRQLDAVELAVRRLLRLVDGLLLLAAGREDKLRLRPRGNDLAVQVQLLVSAWTPAAEQQGLSLAYRGPKRLRAVVDEGAVDRILTNLLSNAIKFTPRGGSIDVEVAPGEERVAISVRDTGIGIDEEFRTRIFGRFEQGRPAVRPGARGSGIGLSLVKELTEAMGGVVEVESPSGGGTLFRVELPLALPEAAGEVERGAAPAGAAIEPQASSPHDFGIGKTPREVAAVEPARPQATILVAEDDPDLGRELADLLRQRYRVLVAVDGLQALQLAEKHAPDLLVTDVGMPGMDGFELTRRFRALDGNRLAPVLLLTAYANLPDRLAGLEAGAVDYVLKPFEPSELLARVRAQLAMRQMALQLHESEKLAALGTLSAGLAHEMRNPANAIVNAIEPLREVLPGDALAPGSPAAGLVDVLEACAQQIALLSRQLLGFKRSGDIERQEVRVPQILAVARGQVQASLDGVHFVEETRYDGMARLSAPLMTQVLANLFENGAHAAGRGGWVRVETRAEEDALVIEVSDSGPGVPRELRERIFEPFFTTKAPGAGTGLGLTMVREIVERHGGRIEVRDAASGSLFHLHIPCACGGARVAAGAAAWT